MRALFRWLAVLTFILLVIAPGGYSTYAQTGEGPTERQRYFPQKHHKVANEFLDEYESIAYSEVVYGYPITEAFHDLTSDRIIQYFERARFELHTENPPDNRVVITKLGELTYKPGPQLSLPNNTSACLSYTEKGPSNSYHVCYAFLGFFEKYGGIDQFGYPISNFEIHDDRIVQYFQRARFEWHPERPTGQRVVLTNLGDKYFDIRDENPKRLLPVPVSISNNRPLTILDLKVRAYALSSILTSSGLQTVYIVVQDQNLYPVSNADVVLEIELPSGETRRTIVPERTDKNGITKFNFTFEDQPSGLTKINIQARASKLQSKTITSFRIWD
jgi:predicted cupin superfamily sugar epimerase